MLPIEAKDALREGDAQAALSLLQNYLRTSRYDFGNQIDYAVLLAKLGQIDEAVVRFRWLIDFAPRLPLLLRHFGRVLHYRGNTKRAANLLSRAVSLNSAEPLWVYYLARIPRFEFIQIAPGILYFPIPKNASSTMKRLTLSLQGVTDSTSVHGSFGSPFLRTRDLPSEAKSASMRFAVLRDPIDRIVSYHRKNIMEARALTKGYAEHVETLFGLPLVPPLAFFVSHLKQYQLCFDDVFHHTLPQSAYVCEPSFFTHLYRIDEMQRLADDLSSALSQPVLMQKRNSSKRQTAAGDEHPDQAERKLVATRLAPYLAQDQALFSSVA